MFGIYQTLVATNEKIDRFEEGLRQVESEILTNEELMKQSIQDNNEKTKFNQAFDEILKFNGKKLSTVLITEKEFEEAVKRLKEFHAKLNSINLPSDSKYIEKLNELRKRKSEYETELKSTKALKEAIVMRLIKKVEEEKKQLEEVQGYIEKMK